MKLTKDGYTFTLVTDHWRVQLYIPDIRISKDRIIFNLGTGFGGQISPRVLKHNACMFKTYKTAYIQILGFGIAIEYAKYNPEYEHLIPYRCKD